MRQLAAILALVLLLPIAQLTAPPAEAAISVVSDETESRFPSGLVFRVRATADQPITDIQINLIIGRERVSSYGRPEFAPGREVSAEYTLRTGADRYIPPMSQITYWYQLKDAGGAQIETPRQTIRYDDPKYRWQTVQRDKLVVFYHDLPAQRAERIADAGMATIAEAKSSFGVDVQNPIAMVVYNSPEQMNAATPPRSAATERSLVLLGQAHAKHDVVLVMDRAGDDRELIETARHELQHVITDQATDNPYSQVPIWLNEGLAVYVQGSGQQAYTGYVSAAQRQNRLFYLRDLNSVPGRPEENLLLYGQGYLVVKYLHDKYGASSLSKLFAAYKAGKTTDQAFTEAFGKPLDGIDTDWRATLGLPPVPERSAGLGSSSPVAVPTVVPFGAQPSGGVPTVAPLGSQPGAAVTSAPSAPIAQAATPAPVLQPTPAASPTQTAPAGLSPWLLVAAGLVLLAVLAAGTLAFVKRG